MKLFRVKFELIILIMLFMTSVAGFVLQKKVECWQTTAMFIISLIMLLVMCLSYNTIKDFRREIIRRW